VATIPIAGYMTTPLGGSVNHVITSIARGGEEGIGRRYATTVENATSKQLEEFIEEKIDKEAEITTGEWK
jgi:hypothetical protein